MQRSTWLKIAEDAKNGKVAADRELVIIMLLAEIVEQLWKQRNNQPD